MLIFLLDIFIGCFVYMLCLPIEIEIFEMVEKKIKKIFGKTHFFQNRVIFIYEALQKPYYLPIAMGG